MECQSSTTPTSDPTLQELIAQKLRANLNIIDLVIKDKSGGCGQSFLAVIIAEEFKDMKLIDRQKKVNEILAAEIAQIHAFEMKTWTAEVWETKKAEYL